MGSRKRTRADAALDSENDQQGSSSSAAMAESPASPTRAAKGQSAFTADRSALAAIFGGTDTKPIKALQSGDSENMATFKMSKPNSKRNILYVEDQLVLLESKFRCIHACRFNLLIPSIDAYPHTHSTTVWAEDDDLPTQITEALDSISDATGIPLKHVLKRVITAVGGAQASAAFETAFRSHKTTSTTSQRKLSKKSNSSAMVIDDDEDTDVDDMHDSDDIFGLQMTSHVAASPCSDLAKTLRSHFKAIQKAGYHPGFTQLADGSHVISISAKISKLHIPPRALDAWDSKLLSHNTRLILLIAFAHGYPLTKEQAARQARDDVRFRVGLSLRSKPDKIAIGNAFRTHSAISTFTPGQFEPFSLAEPFTDMMQASFRDILEFRDAHPERGWASAEAAVIGHHSLPRNRTREDELDKTFAKRLDREERDADAKLPTDPYKTAGSNFEVLAMTFLHRRFALAPWYCLVCHRCVEHVGIRPFCCSDELCRFQYLNLHLGPSIEYEILNNTAAVDLLVNLAYCSAVENEMKDHPPHGMKISAGKGKPDLDDCEPAAKNRILADLINTIPSVADMKDYLLATDMHEHDRAMAATARKLTDFCKESVSASAWSVLRWIIASNTSYLREIDDEASLVANIPKSYKQFVFVSGAPEKETALRREIAKRQETDPNAKKYPTLMPFHGSATKNWHGILRQGLHFSKTTNGRAYGHGVYFALRGETSLHSYAHASTNVWRNAEFHPGQVAGLCEILNAPDQFVSSQPHFVVNRVDWIQTRYLLVQRHGSTDEGLVVMQDSISKAIPADPRFSITLGNKIIMVPSPDKTMFESDDGNESDLAPSDQEIIKRAASSSQVIDISSDEGESTSDKSKQRMLKAQREQYKPFARDFIAHIRTLPGPTSATPRATLQLGKELKSIMQSQAQSSPLELGYHFDPATTNDNLFHWIVELINFDPTLPLAKDMAAKGVKGVLFEILFPAQYPYEPPFFRVIHPRLLPFTQGGGGHIVSAAVCMDLLTAEGWNPAYTIEAVLTQIKMAMSNLEPRPARLDPREWNTPYSIQEAIGGFKRAASTHNWKVPASFQSTANGIL